MNLTWNYVATAILVLALGLNIWTIVTQRRLRNFPRFAQPPSAGVVPKNSIFHRPKNAACPDGTSLLPEYFTERDGTKVDACHNPNGEGSIDYLNPGESCAIPVEIQPAETGKGRG